MSTPVLRPPGPRPSAASGADAVGPTGRRAPAQRRAGRSRHRPGRAAVGLDAGRAGLPLAGAVAAGVGLGIGELASGLFPPSVPSPVVAVGDAVIDLTPGTAVRTGIDSVGRADKPLLLLAIVVASLLLGAVITAPRRRTTRGDRRRLRRARRGGGVGVAAGEPAQPGRGDGRAGRWPWPRRRSAARACAAMPSPRPVRPVDRRHRRHRRPARRRPEPGAPDWRPPSPTRSAGHAAGRSSPTPARAPPSPALAAVGRPEAARRARAPRRPGPRSPCPPAAPLPAGPDPGGTFDGDRRHQPARHPERRLLPHRHRPARARR